MPNSTLLLGAAFVSSIGVADAADRSKYVPQGYVQTFDEEFTSLRTINPGPCCAAPGKNWFNGTEHCCMTPSVAGQIGSLYSAAKNGYSFYPYSLEESGKGLQITLTLHNNIWYSGVLTSEDNAGNGFSQQYGYFEIQTELPVGAPNPGTWPAFWMLNKSNLPQPNPKPAEIDIMESYGLNIGIPAEGFCTTYHNWVAGKVDFQSCGSQNGGGAAENLSGQSNVFGFLWTPTACSVYLNGVLMNTTTACSAPIYQQPFYVLVDLGIGGGWPTANTPKTNVMQVDYIRAYKAP